MSLKPIICPKCQHPQPKYYAEKEGGLCYWCFNLTIIEAYENFRHGVHEYRSHDGTGPVVPFPTTPGMADENSLDYYYHYMACKKGPHALKWPAYGRKVCVTCRGKVFDNPRAAARRANESEYRRVHSCETCGGHQRRVIDNACVPCGASRAKSPRAIARRADQKMYTPTDPCDKCNTTEPRRVDNNACKGCQALRGDARETPDSAFMKAQPDLILPRPQARAMALKVYRTGKPCNRGHTGYRYVTTSGCIQCLRGS